MERIKPVLSYADRETDASFQFDGRMIYIHNQVSREWSYSAWVMAALMAALMVGLLFVIAFVRGRKWLAFDAVGGWAWLIMYGLAVFCMIAVGFQWSTIRVDLESGRIERATRWGPFRGRASAPLAMFDRVVVRGDSDAGVVVELVGAGRMEIVSYRGRAESLRMAQVFAGWVGLPVEFGV